MQFREQCQDLNGLRFNTIRGKLAVPPQQSVSVPENAAYFLEKSHTDATEDLEVAPCQTGVHD